MTEPLSSARVSLLRNVGGPRLSRDGAWVAWLESYAGRGDVLVAPTSGGRARAVTSDPTVGTNVAHGGGSVCWSPTGDELAFVSGKGDLYAVAREGGAPRPILVGFRVAAPVWGDDTVVFCRATTDSSDTGAVDPGGGGWPRRLSRGADFCFDPDVTAGGAVAWHEWDVPAMPWDGGRIVLKAPGREPVTVDGAGDLSVGEPRFSPDGARLAYLCDRDGWRALWLADLDSGRCRPLSGAGAEVGGPAWGAGARSHTWSPDGRTIAFVSCRDAAAALCVVDVGSGRTEVLAGGNGTYSHLSWAGQHLCALYSDLATPPEVRLLDPGSGSFAAVTRVGMAAVPAVTAAHITWPASDGGDLHAILVRPAAATGPLPLVVWPHGGPTDQSRFAFNPRLPWLTSRGYAVLLVNHRGSTGYGREYARALYERWGELDADDVAAAVRHVVARGDATPGRVAIMGGSAGGYVALQCLIRHGELFACGIDLYGVADLFGLAESTWRFEAHYTDLLVGALPAAAAAYRDRSPLHHASRIRVPLLVLHGAEDEVVPEAQSAAIAAAVAANGVEVEHHVYPGEGHGWSRPDTVADELARVETFLRRHLRGAAR